MSEPNPPSLPNNESFLPQSTVLIVDDNAQNVELLQAFLEALPVKLVTAYDGIEALEKVQQHNPDLILLDIMMPRMSGFQVCRKLKTDPQTKDIQILMVTAYDGIEALEKVQQHNPDLILLDIMMPRMSGFQVCRKLKTDPQTKDIQILMVTALNELGDIEQASECGTDDFVSKPVNKFELLTRVKSLLRVRHLKSELERALTYLHEVEQEEESF